MKRVHASKLNLRLARLAGKLLHTSRTRVRLGHEPTQTIVFPKGVLIMLWTIVLILIILWALGFAVHIGGGLIHLLLVIALIVVVVRLIQGRGV
jgi:hypothetical protein